MYEIKMKGLDRFNHSTYYHVVNHAVGNENLFRNDVFECFGNMNEFKSFHRNHTTILQEEWEY
jgi:hypothetical protein